MTTRHTALALVCLAIAGAALAGTLAGIVKDDKGNPVANADVKVYGKDDLKTTSDADGKFKIVSKDLLDGNKYSVTVSADGYDGAQTVSVEMFEDPKDMEPIEVVMYKPEPIPAAWTNAENMPYMSGSISGGVMMVNPGMPPRGWRPESNDSTNDTEDVTTNTATTSKAATTNTTTTAPKPPAAAATNTTTKSAAAPTTK